MISRLDFFVILVISRIGKRFLKNKTVILFFVSWSIAKTFSRNLQIHRLNAKFLFAMIPKKSTVTPRLSEILNIPQSVLQMALRLL
jgi:hypothetical protein